MTQAKKGWSYSAGERGRNRVRAFEHPRTGRIFLEFADNGQRKRIALGHRDRDAARTKAEEVALALRRAEPRRALALTLQTLFDNYSREVTPGKSPSSRQNDRHTARLFREYFGAERKVVTLSRRDCPKSPEKEIPLSTGTPSGTVDSASVGLGRVELPTSRLSGVDRRV